ncbi:MAG: glycoside hydrolase family 99-like domain-containing protein [Bacteroidales bacterium]|jgi:hypothetical protein|nr:glycoside hydrolase family 99-like domain-containing protein [Bacteroidales bacterium]
MKSKYIITVLLFGGLFTACTEDSGPSIDDYPLNYQIEEIAVTSDIPVGIYLYNPKSDLSNEGVWERLIAPYNQATGAVGPNVEPVLGRYALDVNEAGAQNLQTLINWCNDAGINFFVTPGLKENANALYPNNANAGDTAFIRMISGQHALYPLDMGNMKYAIMMDMNNIFAGSNNNLLENAEAKSYRYTAGDGSTRDTVLTREERVYSMFKRASDYFGDPAYMHLNGRPVLVLSTPDKLATTDSRRVYDGIRQTVKEHTGKDVYLIARQTQWTPPARFHYFFLSGGVDAVTMDNMCDVGASYYERSFYLNQLINENFKYNREYIAEHYGIDFAPSVAVSYNAYVKNGTTYNKPIIQKDPDEFRKRCNVAKMNLGRTPLVFVESLNNWGYETAIEPAIVQEGTNGYGTLYLDILRQQFKK